MSSSIRWQKAHDDLPPLAETEGVNVGVGFSAQTSRGHYLGTQLWKVREVAIGILSIALLAVGAWGLHQATLPLNAAKSMVAIGTFLCFRTLIFRPFMAHLIHHAIYPIIGDRYPGYARWLPLASYYNSRASMRHTPTSHWQGDAEICPARERLILQFDGCSWIGDQKVREYHYCKGKEGQLHSDKVMIITVKDRNPYQHWSFVNKCYVYLEQGYSLMFLTQRVPVVTSAETAEVVKQIHQVLSREAYYSDGKWRAAYAPENILTNGWEWEERWRGPPPIVKNRDMVIDHQAILGEQKEVLYKHEIRSIQSLDGTSIHTRFIKGKKDKPHSSEVIVYSFGNSHLYHSNEMLFSNLCLRYLEQGYSIMVYDPPGYGETAGPRSPPKDFLALEAVTQYLVEVKGLSEGKQHHVGHSIGSGAVMELSTQYDFASVSLVGGLGSMVEVSEQLMRNEYQHTVGATAACFLSYLSRWFLGGVVRDYYGYDNITCMQNTRVKRITLHESTDDHYMCDLLPGATTASQATKLQEAWNLSQRSGRLTFSKREKLGHMTPDKVDLFPEAPTLSEAVK